MNLFKFALANSKISIRNYLKLTNHDHKYKIIKCEKTGGILE